METNDDSKYSLGKCLEVGLKFLAAHHIPPEVLLWPLAAVVLYFEKTSCMALSESDLKERKKRGEKKKSPRTPLIKEKQPEKIEKEILSLDADAKEVFRKECLSFIGHYDEQQVTDFYHYWSEASKRGTMRFQRQKYWDTEKRLKRWCKNRYSSENTAAALRLERLKKKAPETEPERERKQQRLEQEIAERKRNAVSYEEYLRMKNGE